MAGLMPGAAWAQAESREGLYLQNQILQLRQEMELMRRAGPVAPQVVAPSRGGVPAGGGELVAQLLERVAALEDEVRRQRGLAEQAEFRNRTLQQQVEKLQGDVEYRFNQIESRGAAGAAPAGRAGGGQQGALNPSTPSAPAAPPAPAGQPAAPTPRTPEVALREGQTALERRDYAAAEAAAREVLAARAPTRAQDAGILLGDSLIGKRDYQNAALAYDEAYRRAKTSGRAPEAMVGLANAFNGFGAKREACQTLDDLRSQFPRVPASLAERVAGARQRAGCR
ncbi:tetratricopeptide repeat protein [Muricoccus aerilatus]|uniref:tetratricopeptide repeat protein n=1 Tax=Muricoccus aerilatus TaxID=452982 RepID=UPI000A7F89A4|nr:tetratricopeptide repeat protein [Roseomonas aerilata]